MIMKKLTYLTLACILLLVACGNQVDYPYFETESPAVVPTLTPQPTSMPTPMPTPIPSPTPVETYQINQLPHYAKITGQIISVEGLLNDDGSIHEAVDWLHVNIEDEDGTHITLVATPATVVPFGNLFVGETVTGFLLADRPSIANEPPMYIASVLVAGMPDGLNIHVHYFDRAFETRLSVTGNPFLASICLEDRLPEINDTLASWGNRIFIRTEDTIMTPFARENYEPPYAGFAMLYAIPEPDCTEPIPIIESILISESFDGRDNWEDWEGEFQIPEMFTLSDFEIFDRSVFLHQELFDLPMPPILYHDGTTVMVPFKPIGQEIWWTVSFVLFPSGAVFGTIGGGSGETALMMPGGTTAGGTGHSASFGTPALLVDGILYVPLLGFFAGASPFPPSDAFIYNNEIHIVHRGWSILHDTQYWRAGFGQDSSEGHQITVDVSRLPIYVNRQRINASSAFLTEDKYDIMLPMIPLTEALGFCVTILPCGCILVEDNAPNGRLPVFLIEGQYAEVKRCYHEVDMWWEHMTFAWIDGEIYASFWEFFRRDLNAGGFASHSRIELFTIGARHLWPQPSIIGHRFITE